MDIWLIILIINDAVIALLIFAYFFYKHKNRHAKDEEEIISLVNESQNRGYIEDNEALLINNIFEFGDKQAKDIMMDRSNIVAIDSDSKLSQALEFMLDSGHSRFPVFSNDLDNIQGIIHIKDAMSISRIKGNSTKKISQLPELIRDARFIPETRKIDSLFRTMQTSKLQMVIVIDEYGQTAGLLAMEDILEEIVGNILDEYDDDDGHIVERGYKKYIVDGITPLEDIEKKLDIKFEDTECETINGYLIIKMEKIPDKKDRFEIKIGEYNFKVLEVDHNMIQQVLVYQENSEEK